MLMHPQHQHAAELGVCFGMKSSPTHHSREGISGEGSCWPGGWQRVILPLGVVEEDGLDLVAVHIGLVSQVGHNLLHLLGKGCRAEEEDRCWQTATSIALLHAEAAGQDDQRYMERPCISQESSRPVKSLC